MPPLFFRLWCGERWVVHLRVRKIKILRIAGGGGRGLKFFDVDFRHAVFDEIAHFVVVVRAVRDFFGGQFYIV